ncbi:DEAD/DEAH box helicase [Rhodococcus sp. Q]|uniref:DEAD/DEAH box helicase n=1 Tax=Rhodococcus sp. Q TaxID=2502252 RepID=UPI0010F906FB|nr:DEAD/DEAH box helicase [Rhodococcus sp. Q]
MSEPVRFSNYGNGPSLHGKLLELISGARRRVWIKVPWWDTSTPARALLDAVVAAKRRGVDVLVLSRPEASNDAVHRELRAARVKLVAVRYIHEKELIADDEAITYSMNFTGTEIERNENSGNRFTRPEDIEPLEAGFRTLVDNRAAASLGDEQWTGADKIIPTNLQKFLTRYARLNPLQSKAVPAVLSTPGHVMVVAPTSAGKTLIGEVAALRSIVGDGKPAVWLLPARALAAEIGETARRWRGHGINAIELTGETNISSDAVRRAQLWVATTEKFEALYRRSSLRDFIAKVGCIIIDEVHLVGDPERGATLESLIARLRAVEGRTRIVALSATVSNAEELASWFNAQLIRSAWRPTILTTQLVPYDEPPEGSRREQFEGAKDRVMRSLLAELRDTPTPPATDGDGSTGPASVLVFCGSKNAARRTAAQAADLTEFRGLTDDQLVEATFERGVGLHFRDAPRAGRALSSFKDRSIATLVATSGLSTGVNTPARAVVIRDLELGMSPLEVSQAQQMLGRAGRAGQEPEGFGFLLVPRHQEASWRRRLADGYAARSQVVSRLIDVILAEILLGSITDRRSAASWFEETFAYAQSGEPLDVDDAVDHLVRRGFVTELDGGLAVTELGALTSRLMVDVESAGAMLTAITDTPLPTSASEAEEFVIAAATGNVGKLRDWPVNRKAYDSHVQWILAPWSLRAISRVRDDFGAKFCMAAAHLALRDPRKLHATPPKGVSLAEFRRAIDDLPRYLAWIAALGYLDTTTWMPAVAGDLARRLSWWHLTPHPDRGSGRLLWFLEKTLEPQNRNTAMQDLWRRATSAGFTGPDRINTRPGGVDVSPDQFTDLARGRAHLDLTPPQRLTLPVTTSTTDARLTIMSTAGSHRAISTTCPAGGRVEIPVPRGADTDRIAADVFLYTRSGDFAYRNLVTDLPADALVGRSDPVADAAALIPDLRPVAVVTQRFGKVRRLLMTDRRKRATELLALLAPDPQLRPVAAALSGHEAEPDLAVIALRENLPRLLAERAAGALRPAAAVLTSWYASPDEFELTIAALAGALNLEVGVASRNDALAALVCIGSEWHLVSPSDEALVRVEALIPDDLPPILRSVHPPQPEEANETAARCAWLTKFAAADCGENEREHRDHDVATTEPGAVSELGKDADDTQDTATSRHLWEKAADLGDADAMYALGVLADDAGDTRAARRWWQKAADLGHPEAMCNLGVLAVSAGDTAAAHCWWEKAADLGDPTAMYNLGEVAAEAEDSATARHWYEESADLGDADAMYALGVLADDAGDATAARRWWQKAADRNHTGAAGALH